ncbi:glycosyltransferase family 1 protein [Microcoleus sp. AR_TQ3_B6]|uniref:glycosyltransferase family 1 protein n=1 Tax=Microcoleus sp. AR_TQ3_B6 TaxID=3055284 RepID=UPI002FD3707A
MRKQNHHHMLVDKPSIRILHAVGGMNRAGTETWLMHILRNIDRDRFQMDFLVHTDQPCAYDEEIRTLGSKIIPCLDRSKPWLYSRNLKRVLREYGPYDIIHSHVHHFSGYILWLAKQVGVPIRIAHSHNDTSEVDAHASFLRRLYTTLMKGFIQGSATTGLAASRVAAVALFGDDWENNPRWQVLYCGIDLTPFKTPVDGLVLRRELGIPEDAFIIGHVGRFEDQKNHLFILEIAAIVAKKYPGMRLLLIGDGILRSMIEEKVKQMGLTPYVIFAGLRSDVPQLMQSMMDVFLLPSIHEGLPVVGIEAQAAGLPLVLSDVITDELDRSLLIKRLSLSRSALQWSDLILNTWESQLDISKPEMLKIMEYSPFNIQNSLTNLVNLYQKLYISTQGIN